MKFLKGMGTGLLVGACLGYVMAPDRRAKKRQVGGAIKSMGRAIEELGGSVRF